mgnify:CR=1 FL=1
MITMKQSERRFQFHKFLQILLLVVLIASDQLTKYLAASSELLRNSVFPLIGNAVVLHYVENTGAAFGFFQNRQVFFYIFTVIIVILIAGLYLTIHRKLINYSRLDQAVYHDETVSKMLFLTYFLIVLCAGAVGNLIDRIAHGYVIDFISVQWIQFPVFNFADIYVTVSAVILVVFFLLFYKEDPNFRLKIGRFKGK